MKADLDSIFFFFFQKRIRFYGDDLHSAQMGKLNIIYSKMKYIGLAPQRIF